MQDTEDWVTIFAPVQLPGRCNIFLEFFQLNLYQEYYYFAHWDLISTYSQMFQFWFCGF